MSNQLDVYRDWLGIAETARPLNFYQLLRLSMFEDSAAKVRVNYRKMNAHVRKFATGEYAAQSQALLNELAKAMLCLTDADRKREYDASLGRRDGGSGRRSFEDILLGNKLVDQEQLTKARRFADATGLGMRDAIVQQKLAGPDVVMMSYAESLGLPYVELEDIGVDEQLAPCVPPDLARQHACVPVMIDQGQLLMASPNPLIPDVEEELRLRFNMPVRTVLCTAAGVNQAIAKHYPRGMVAVAPVVQPKRQEAAAPPPKKESADQPAKPQQEAAAAPAAPKVFTPEQRKLHLVIAGAATGLTTFLCLLCRMMFFKSPYNNVTIGVFFVALGIGLVVGAVGYVVARAMNVKA